MVDFDLQRYRKGSRLMLSKRDIETIADAVLQDFKPQALKDPIALSADEFLEQYLGCHLRYENLSNNGSILGMVVYNGGKLIVYDKDNDNIEEIFLRGKTVLIDNLLLAEEQRGRYEFTGFHEGGHCILHQPETVSGFFDHRKTIVCRTSETFARFKNLTTDEDWAEWQADYFSACMKLPRRIVRMVAIDAMREIGVEKDCVTSYERDVYRECCEYLPRLIASIFTTSRTAAKYRLMELKILKEKRVQPIVFQKNSEGVEYVC